LVGSGKSLVKWYQLKLPRNRTQGLGSSAAGNLEVMEIRTEDKMVASGDVDKSEASHVTFFRTNKASTMADLKAIEGTGALSPGYGPFH
jgi:hypothetical protein